jgi:UDP-N-acetylglucosamine 2-epimerase (non-hydrolysing)
VIPHRIVSFIGTRPEAIKMAPVAIAISAHPNMTHQLIATGQQEALFNDSVSALGIGIDHHLGNHLGGDMDDQLHRLEASIENILVGNEIDMVLVQGDTNTALAAARAASKNGFKVGHVEAGLRSHNVNRPFPEEANRIEIAKLATVHFAPSAIAAQNLADEGIFDHVYVTGNPGIDAILARRIPPDDRPKNSILVTCHRRENFGLPLPRICDALIEIMAITGQTIVLPVHPNPNVSLPLKSALSGQHLARLVAPLAYGDMISAIQNSLFVITDSGGLQEECAALGVPLLLLREETERPEVVTNGNAIIVGSDTSLIVTEALRLMNDQDHYARMSTPSFPYGSGDAARQIVDAICQHFSQV